MAPLIFSRLYNGASGHIIMATSHLWQLSYNLITLKVYSSLLRVLYVRMEGVKKDHKLIQEKASQTYRCMKLLLCFALVSDLKQGTNFERPLEIYRACSIAERCDLGLMFVYIYVLIKPWTISRTSWVYKTPCPKLGIALTHRYNSLWKLDFSGLRLWWTMFEHNYIPLLDIFSPMITDFRLVSAISKYSQKSWYGKCLKLLSATNWERCMLDR